MSEEERFAVEAAGQGANPAALLHTLPELGMDLESLANAADLEGLANAAVYGSAYADRHQPGGARSPPLLGAGAPVGALRSPAQLIGGGRQGGQGGQGGQSGRHCDLFLHREFPGAGYPGTHSPGGLAA